MTCVVGLECADRVHLAGDGVATGKHEVAVWTDAKVFTLHNMVFGFSGSFRVGQTVRHAFVPPSYTGDDDGFTAHLATAFASALRACLRVAGVRMGDTSMLIGRGSRLYKMESNLQVNRVYDGFAAIGCGDELATGALYATQGLVESPKKRLRLALEAAERYNLNVRRPFTFVTTRAPRKRKQA